MNVMPYEPWNALQRLNEDVNRLFGRASPWLVDEGDGSTVLTSHWMPAVDIREEPDRFVISADVPGVNRDDIDITMESGLLTIKGERKLAREQNREGYRRTERLHGTFYRRFSLPNGADAEHISATCKDGVLEVVIPKEESVKPRRIEVRG